MPKLSSCSELKSVRDYLCEQSKNLHKTLMVCGGTGCQTSRSQTVIDAIQRELSRYKLEERFHLRVTGCQGFCEQGPILIVAPDNLFYCHVTARDAPEIISRTILRDEVIERLLYVDQASGLKCRTVEEIPFYTWQDRRILSQNLMVDPTSIEDYIRLGGYSALAKVLKDMGPAKIIKEIKSSGLRERGGGGAPAWGKWAACEAAAGDEKYVVCYADEGDPGAYLQRCVLEGNPHLVLEGMMIGARAVGATRGYIYIPNEFELSLEHSLMAIRQARDWGLLGERIMGSSFSFDLDVSRGGGVFVYGEASALVSALEGKVGEPKSRNVNAVIDGLFHKPTMANNVETWANVPAILSRGSAWFALKGDRGSKGTKILALTGRIKNSGLVEVDMGTPLSTVIYDIGGGAPGGKLVKAIQVGGPSGGCLPAQQLSLPVDYDILAQAGYPVGSGGVVVMDEESCMVDNAKHLLTSLQGESCGKCLPCRLGIDRMLEIVTEITEGRGKPEHLDLLQELGETISQTALCDLGKTAPNQVLAGLRYFRGEYESHILNHQCRAGVCKALFSYAIDWDKCTGCGDCLDACANKAIRGGRNRADSIDAALCQKCGICRSECRFGAVRVV